MLAYVLAFANVIPTFARVGLNHSIITFVAKKELDLAKNANHLAFVISIPTALLLFLVDPFVGLLSFSFTSFIMQIGNYLGQRNYKVASVSQVLRSGIWIVVAIPLYFIMDISGILLGMTIGNIILSYNYFRSIKFSDWNFNKLKAKSQMIFHNFGVVLSHSIPNQIDKFLIVPIFGFQTTGIFHFAVQALFSIELLSVVLHKFLLAEQSSGKISKRFIYLATFSTVTIILAGIFAAPIIIENIFSEYKDSIPAIQLIVFGTIPLVAIAVLNAKLLVVESNLVGYGVIVRVGTNLALIPTLGELLGVIGLVIANLVSLVLLTVYLLIIYRRVP